MITLEDGVDFLGFMVMIVLVSGVMAVFVVGSSILFQSTMGRATCTSFSTTTGLETEFDIWNGCYVHMQDGVVPKSSALKIMENDYNLHIVNE